MTTTTTSHSARSRSFLIDSLLSPSIPGDPSTTSHTSTTCSTAPPSTPFTGPIGDGSLQPAKQLSHVHPQMVLRDHVPVGPAALQTAASLCNTALAYDQPICCPSTPAGIFVPHEVVIPARMGAVATGTEVVPVIGTPAVGIPPRKRASSLTKSKPVVTAVPAVPLVNVPRSSPHAITSAASRAVPSPLMLGVMGSSVVVGNSNRQSNKCNASTNANTNASSNHPNSGSSNNSHSHHGTGKKKTGIPVGIAVARQRNNKDSQISPKSVVLVTSAAETHLHHNPLSLMNGGSSNNNISTISSPTLMLQQQHQHHHVNGKEAAKVMAEKLNGKLVVDPIISASSVTTDAPSYQSVIARDSISGKLLVLIPTSSSNSSPTISRSATPIKLSGSEDDDAAAATAATAESAKALTITTDGDEDDKSHHDLTSKAHVREEDLLLKRVSASSCHMDETLDQANKSSAVCKPNESGRTADKSDAGSAIHRSISLTQTSSSASFARTAMPAADARSNGARRSGTGPSSMNALVVEQNQSVLNFINARGLDLLVDLVEQQQPENFSQTITRHVPLSATGTITSVTQSTTDCMAALRPESLSLSDKRGYKEESNLDLLSMLCEQRCRDEKTRRQQVVRENNKRRLSYPSCEIPDASQVEAVIRVNGCQEGSSGIPGSDPESCVPLKKRIRRFSSLDPSQMTDAKSHDSESATTVTTSEGSIPRTVPSITIQTSPKNSSGHAGLMIKIKKKEVSEAASSCSSVTSSPAIKVLLKKQPTNPKNDKSTKKKDTNRRSATDRKVHRKEHEVGEGCRGTLDPKKKKGTKNPEKHDIRRNEGKDDESIRGSASSIPSIAHAAPPTALQIIPSDPYDFTSTLEFDSVAGCTDPLDALKKHKKKHKKKEKKEKRKHRTGDQEGNGVEAAGGSTTTGQTISQVGKANKSITSASMDESNKAGKSRKSPKKTSTSISSRIKPSIPDPVIIASKKGAALNSPVKSKAATPANGTTSRLSQDQPSSSKAARPGNTKRGHLAAGHAAVPVDSGNDTHCHNNSSTNNHNNTTSSNDWFAIRRSERIFFAHEFGSSFTLRDKRESDDDESGDGSDEGEGEEQDVPGKKSKTKARREETKDDESGRKNKKKGTGEEDECSLTRTSTVLTSATACRAGVGVGGEKRKRDRDHKSKHHKHHHKKHKRHKRKHEPDEAGILTTAPNKETDSCCTHDYSSSVGKEEELTTSAVTSTVTPVVETMGEDKSLADDATSPSAAGIAVSGDEGRYSASSTGISIRFTQLRRSLDECSEATTMESNPGIFCWEFQGSPIKKSYQSTTRTKKSRTTIRKDFFNAVKRTRVGCSPVRRISSESSPPASESLDELDDDHEMILKVGECAIFCSSSPSSTPPLQPEPGSLVTGSPSTGTVNPLTECRPRLPFIGRIDSFWRETCKTQTGSMISPGSTGVATTAAPAPAATAPSPPAAAVAAVSSVTSSPEKGEYNLRKGSSPTKKPKASVKVLGLQAINCPPVIEEEEKMMVKVRWFYHPAEAVSKNKKTDPMRLLCDPEGGLFESFTHSDENDVQTIATKCLVLTYDECKRHQAKLCKDSSSDRRVYYLAGKYEPLVKEVTYEPGVPLNSLP